MYTYTIQCTLYLHTYTHSYTYTHTSGLPLVGGAWPCQSQCQAQCHAPWWWWWLVGGVGGGGAPNKDMPGIACHCLVLVAGEMPQH